MEREIIFKKPSPEAARVVVLEAREETTRLKTDYNKKMPLDQNMLQTVVGSSINESK